MLYEIGNDANYDPYTQTFVVFGGKTISIYNSILLKDLLSLMYVDHY